MFYNVNTLLLRQHPNFRNGEQYCISVDGKIGIAKAVGNVLKPGFNPSDWTRYMFMGDHFDLSNKDSFMVKGEEIAPAMFIYSWGKLAKKEELPAIIPLAFLLTNNPKDAREWNYHVRKPENPSIPKYCMLFGCPQWKVEELMEVENKYVENPWLVRNTNDPDKQFILRDEGISKSLYNYMKPGRTDVLQFKTRDSAVSYMNRDVDWAIDEYYTNKDYLMKCLRQAKFRISNEAPDMVSVGKGMMLGVKYACHSKELDYDFIPDHIDENGFYRTADGYIIDESIQANTSVVNTKLLKAYGKYMSYRYIASSNMLERNIQSIEEMLDGFDTMDDEKKQSLVKKVKIAIEKAKEIA